MTRILAALAAIIVLGLTQPARAAWPDHTITIVVHFAPGGSNDLLGRLMAAELGPRLGVSVIVENRPGADGNVGLSYVARAAPDGYTLAVASGVVLVNPSLQHTTYDPLVDFAPVAYLGSSPTVILTRPNSGFDNVAELIAKAKAAPDRITYSSPGVGSLSQLMVLLMELRTGTKFTHVPYSGAAPAAQAAIAGVTDLASVNISGMMGLVNSGSLRPLLQSGAQRWPELPNTPTMEQAGMPDAVVDTSQMMLAPAGTPKPIIDRLAHEVLEVMQDPDIVRKMAAAGFGVQVEGPEQLQKIMATEVPRWKAVIDEAGLKPR